jgi:lipoate-protein ligase A
MIYLIDNRDESDPRINLAIEEFCLRQFSPSRSYIIVYANRPSVIIGRHQNILQEVDLRFAEKERLQVVRRISGGGAVYHDFGNLNFCFINNYNSRSITNTRQRIAPVQFALKSMGISAIFNQKNDLFVNGSKVSGNAQFSNMRRILVHGTLLFDSHLDHLKSALNPFAEHITSAARKSVVSPVTNISSHLKTRLSLRAFRGRLLASIAERCGGMKKIHLNETDWRAIERLSEEKYQTWDWNCGKAPAFTIIRNGSKSTSQMGYSIDVKNGQIVSIRFESKNMSQAVKKMIEDGLAGVPFHQKAISTRLNQIESTISGKLIFKDNLADIFAAELGCAHKPVLQIPRRDLF